MERSALSRLWRPYLFGIALVAVSAVWAASYIPPTASLRLFPSVPPAVATIAAMVAANFAVFVAWRRPELWARMNRYFLLSSGHPNWFSVIGSVFSHQTFRHFGGNMLLLAAVGISGTSHPWPTE
jgi:rhomboid-like protein